MTEELIKLIMSVSGQDVVKDLQQQLAYTEATIEQLKDAFKRGDMTTDEFLRTAKRLSDQQKQLQENIRLTAEAMDKQAAASKAGAAISDNIETIGKSGTNAAYKMMQFGQTLDDLQYVGEMGLRPIINNVMQLSPELGIALIAVQSLASAIGEKLISEMMGLSDETDDAKSKVEQLTEKVEQLEKKPHKLAVDFKDLEEAQAKLDKLKADESAYDSAKNSDPEKQLAKEAQAATTKYAGGADQLTAIVDAMEKQSGFKHGDASLYAKLDKLKYQLENPEFDARTGVAKYDPEVTKKNIAEVEAAIERARKDYAKGQVTAFAAGDPAAIEAMQNRVARNPGAFNRQGLDGVTAGEAIRNLPTSVKEMARRLEVDQEISETDEKDKGNKAEFSKARSERLRREAKAQADEDRHVVEEQDMAERRRKEIAAKEKHDADVRKRQEERRRAQAEREEAQRERDRRDPIGIAQREMQLTAQSGLRQMGYGGGVADIAAPKLAELVAKGMDVQAATMQAVHEAQQQILMANRALQQNLQMQALIQQQQRRARIMMPTTQPMPFAN